MASKTDTAITGIRLYRGACHCGAVVFECELDFSAGTQRCNCAACSKQRFWKAMVADSAFRLLGGETNLSDYQFGSHRGWSEALDAFAGYVACHSSGPPAGGLDAERR